MSNRKLTYWILWETKSRTNYEVSTNPLVQRIPTSQSPSFTKIGLECCERQNHEQITTSLRAHSFKDPDFSKPVIQSSRSESVFLHRSSFRTSRFKKTTPIDIESFNRCRLVRKEMNVCSLSSRLLFPPKVVRCRDVFDVRTKGIKTRAFSHSVIILILQLQRTQ